MVPLVRSGFQVLSSASIMFSCRAPDKGERDKVLEIMTVSWHPDFRVDVFRKAALGCLLYLP